MIRHIQDLNRQARVLKGESTLVKLNRYPYSDDYRPWQITAKITKAVDEK